MKEVACRYGIEVLKNTCLCPFHQEQKHLPAYGCMPIVFIVSVVELAGDVVSFVARLCGIRNQQAAVRINEDFCLGLNLGYSLPNDPEAKRMGAKRIPSKRGGVLEKTSISGSFSLPEVVMECSLWRLRNSFMVGVVGEIGHLRLLLG